VAGDTAISSSAHISFGRLTAAAVFALLALGPGPAAYAQTSAPPSAPARAAAPASPLYLSITGGPAKAAVPDARQRPLAETDPGVRIGGVVGYAFSRTLRAEIEAFYEKEGLGVAPGAGHGLDMRFTPSLPAIPGSSLYGTMARGYWEPGAATGFSPYIGGGIGLASVGFDITVDGTRAQEDENLLTYEFTAGARYAITPSSSVRAGYRLSGISEPERAPARDDSRIHAIEFGFNIRF